MVSLNFLQSLKLVHVVHHFMWVLKTHLLREKYFLVDILNMMCMPHMSLLQMTSHHILHKNCDGYFIV